MWFKKNLNEGEKCHRKQVFHIIGESRFLYISSSVLYTLYINIIYIKYILYILYINYIFQC